jgi:hypothetical protein
VADEIHTRYVKGGFAVSDEVVLSTSPTTRILFRPAIHKEAGVRGVLVRQKIGANGVWKNTNEVDFRQLPADCGVLIELDSEATALLFEKLDQLLIDDKRKTKAIGELLAQGHSAEVWEALVKNDPDLASRLAAAQLQLDRQGAIRRFGRALRQHRDDESRWQKFFERHPWMLQSAFSAAVFQLAGETYVGGKKPIGRQGKGGVATDFLFSDASTKSFAVVEIKTPNTPLISKIYRGESGSGLDNETYSMSDELSGGVVQTRNQVAVAVEDFHAVVGKGFEGINRVHPKGVLVIGDLGMLDSRQQASFNQFRHGLYSLTVITFDELLRRLCILYDVDSEDADV